MCQHTKDPLKFLTTFSTVLGTIALVFYTFPYLGIIFIPMGALYYIISIYYRRSSVETKRLDSLLRSILYGSYSGNILLLLIPEHAKMNPHSRDIDRTLYYPCISWTGRSIYGRFRFLTLIWAQNRCVKDAEHRLDMENRAYLMTISMQRWLAVRLDLFGNTLVLGIALFAAGFRTTVNPVKIGVVLSYTLASKFNQNFMVYSLTFFFYQKWLSFSVSDNKVSICGKANVANV